MTSGWFVVRRATRVLLLLGLAAALTGCDPPQARFRTNMVYVRQQEKSIREEFSPQKVQDIGDVMAALFGTPDEPYLPALADAPIEELLQLRRLRMAAGPVGSDELGRPHGLYREHCAHCHGITGDGSGPTAAFLNPYPRDFRRGMFKFKSTVRGQKPTTDDLRQILREGIPGTAMPSFRLLPADEIESLVQYVKYLSIRGEVERNVILETSELEEDERLVDMGLRQTDPATFAEQLELLRSLTSRVVRQWLEAPGHAAEVPPRPKDWDLAESIQRGRHLYYGAVANCFTCHGDTALGDGQTNDFDDWAKDIDPEDPGAVREYLALGALPPRNIIPRNLRQGVYRGGRRPIDIYWRIRNGIDGTPMPAPLMKPDDAPADVQGLTSDDIWRLVDYVQSLPYESISQPAGRQPHYHRERL